MNYVASIGRKIIRKRIQYDPTTTGTGCIKKSALSSVSSSNDSIDGTALLRLLQQVKDGTLSVDKAVIHLSQQQQINNAVSTSVLSSFANIDHDRYTRTNFPEVIFAQSKTSYQVAKILDEMAERQIMKQQNAATTSIHEQKKRFIPPILATRVTPEMYVDINERFKFNHGSIKYKSLARIICMHAKVPTLTTNIVGGNIDITSQSEKRVVVATAGTTDISVAEEAAVTLEASDVMVDRIYDVGVAGLHRIINALPKLTHPNVGCIIVCAGMDGALPSVVGGLVQVPVIAVPTSIGYGASFQGVSALLTMLNSCAPGVGVVNIDNGFGAAALAYKCIQK